MPPLEFELTTESLQVTQAAWDERFGAQITFVGVVRRLEGDHPIAGIDYSAYPAMAERVCDRLGREAERRFGDHRARMIHRVGFVAAAAPSVSLQVSSAHSSAAFDLCRWYLDRMKADVPIWKRIVSQQVAP